MKDCFVNEVASSPLKDYLGPTTDLHWVEKTFTIKDFKYKKSTAPVKQRFFTNPKSKDCPSVYAQFP
ncbi:MAG: hypothetical protein ORN85_07190, partial [Sediminibacterium sp.]|nr:hypothetical protein [Sediminibacterium sp.]